MDKTKTKIERKKTQWKHQLSILDTSQAAN